MEWLVVMPAEKFEECGCEGWDIKGVTFTDWDSLYEGGYKNLTNYGMVLVCPFFADIDRKKFNRFVETPLWRALRFYLQGEGNVIFLIPTMRYRIQKPYPYMVETEEDKEDWKKRYEYAWQRFVLDPTLRLIESCTGVKEVVFEPLELAQEVDCTPAGDNGNALKAYLSRCAPCEPLYSIVVKGGNVFPLAVYKHNRGRYAAVKVVTKEGGVAILLPFDGENLTRNDIELLLKLCFSLSLVRVYAFFGSAEHSYEDNWFRVGKEPKRKGVNLSYSQIQIVKNLYESRFKGDIGYIVDEELKKRLVEVGVDLGVPKKQSRRIDDLVLQVNRKFKRNGLSGLSFIEKVPNLRRAWSLNPKLIIIRMRSFEEM